ncbi:MAG: GNAT family N-acetyltransferase [Phycisphaerales bacterium]
MPDSAWVLPVTLHDPVLAPTIRLEPLETRHAADLFASADPDLFRFSMQNPPEWSVRGFELEMEKVKATPGVVALAMVLASPLRVGGEVWSAGRAIGRSTYMDIRPEHRGLEVGRTWIARAFHGTRVNPEAKYLMFRHAFEALTPTAIRVQLTINGPNLHSQRAVAKLGAVREGVLRSARIIPGFPPPHEHVRPGPAQRDLVVFSIVAEEWPKVKQGLEARLRA